MDDDGIEQALRYFELDLLDETGYGIQLDVEQTGHVEIDIRRRYKFISGQGIVEDSDGYVGGETLLALAARKPLHGVVLAEAKQLLRCMLNVHLQGRPLKSREVLARIIRYL
jgi:DNA repair protein RecO (recombination protein O)